MDPSLRPASNKNVDETLNVTKVNEKSLMRFEKKLGRKICSPKKGKEGESEKLNKKDIGERRRYSKSYQEATLKEWEIIAK